MTILKFDTWKYFALCFQESFNLFMKSLNSNFVFISLARISFCYLYSFTLRTLGRNIRIKAWHMLEAVLEKRPNLKPRNPFSFVGASKSFRINKISISSLPVCILWKQGLFFPSFCRKGKVAFVELWPKRSWGNNNSKIAVYLLIGKLLFTMTNL